jgi:Flp pilus assembly protein TadG
MSRRHLHRDEGAALVELPVVFVAFCLFALAFTAVGQMWIEYHHLTGAARAAARYATKSDYDPTTGSSSRRPSPDQVAAFAKQAASPLPAGEVHVTLTPDTAAGDGVDIHVEHTVDSPAYRAVTGLFNGVLGLVGRKPIPPLTMHADATAIYE